MPSELTKGKSILELEKIEALRMVGLFCILLNPFSLKGGGKRAHSLQVTLKEGEVGQQIEDAWVEGVAIECTTQHLHAFSQTPAHIGVDRL